MLVENELKKLKTFDLSYFKGKNHFGDDATQNYLVFQPTIKYFKRIAGVGSGEYICFGESKGLSNEGINCIRMSNNGITHLLDYTGTKIRVKFNGNCLKQDKITYNHGKIVSTCIVYEISKNYVISGYPTLENCLFGAVGVTKHTDIDQYKYSGYVIGFNRNNEFSFGNVYGKNVIIFGADTSNSWHPTNKTQSIIVLGRDSFTVGLTGTTIYLDGVNYLYLVLVM